MSSIKKRVWLKDRAQKARPLPDVSMPVALDYAGADPVWSCNRKKTYSDEKFARRVAGLMRAERGANVVAYACRHCGNYHIGRAPG